MSNIYREKILDHFNNPRNFGKLSKFTHTAKVENLSCGDKIQLWVKVDANETIEKASFEGEGCVISVAAMSLLVEDMLGKKTDEIILYTDDKIVDMLGIRLGPTRRKCAMLSLKVAQKALTDKEISN